jgi:PAS domain S-box-containing protein
VIPTRRSMKSQNWHRLYYLLATFSAITFVGGLLLNHRLVGMLRASVAQSAEWEARIGAYAALLPLASAVSAPGDDIFEHSPATEQDVANAERRLAAAQAAFEQARQDAAREARGAIEESAQRLLLADLASIGETTHRVVGEQRLVFDSLRRDRRPEARHHNVLMDRAAADVTALISKLNRDAVALSAVHLIAYAKAAEAQRKYEAAFGLAMLLMVGAATIYGVKMSSRLKADAQQRSELIEKLRDSESALEKRVAERTAALTGTARQLADAQRTARLGSWEFDLITQAVSWSDEMFRLLGFEPGEIESTYELYLSLLHPDDRAASQAAIGQAIETGMLPRHDERLIRHDGTERVFHAAGEVIRDGAGRPVRLIGSAQDVTELRAVEAAVRRSEERFQYAARATNDALWDWDIHGRTIWWNEAFRNLFGHQDPRPTVDFRMSLVHRDDAARIGAGIHAFLESTLEFWTAEYRFQRADGSHAWVLDRGYAIRNEAGRAVRMIGSMMDITDRKQSERMKSDFVSFVSHQLRTPLAGMNWMLELAAETDGIPDEARAHIADARQSAARLATLVNDLLDIAKLESGRLSAVPEPLALATLTQSVVAEIRPLADGKALGLEVKCDPVRRVFADAQMLRQVVTNLLSNAVKYTPNGGRIAVHVGQHNGTVTWSVRDTGVGVPKGAQARLFEKFYRADNAITMDAEGTGLGLHLVRLIVEQAGGRVWCESEEGQGAMFAFTLPAMAAEKGAI